MGDKLRLHHLMMPPPDPPAHQDEPAAWQKLGPNSAWLPFIALVASAAIAYLLLGGELPPDLPLLGETGQIDSAGLIK